MIKVKYQELGSKEIQTITFKNEETFEDFSNRPGIIVLETEREGAAALNRIFG